MWSSDRRAFLLGSLALAGCGFTPAYGPGGGAAELRGRIALKAPGDKLTFDLNARLEDRLGAASAPIYLLTCAITTNATGVAITPDGAVTRYNLTGTAAWRLVETATGNERLTGTAKSFTSYSATGSTVAGLAAEEDARGRLMVILADQIVTRLIAAAPQLTPRTTP